MTPPTSLMARDQFRLEILLLAFFRSRPRQLSLNWAIISSFLILFLLLSFYSGSVLPVRLSSFPHSAGFSLTTPLRLLTLLLITKHTGAINADLQQTPVPLSIHSLLPSAAISPSLPSFLLCCWSKVALSEVRSANNGSGLQQCSERSQQCTAIGGAARGSPVSMGLHLTLIKALGHFEGNACCLGSA